MIFQRASDIDLVWVDLYEEMQANDQHPELQYRRLEQMLTIFSPKLVIVARLFGRIHLTDMKLRQACLLSA